MDDAARKSVGRKPTSQCLSEPAILTIGDATSGWRCKCYCAAGRRCVAARTDITPRKVSSGWWRFVEQRDSSGISPEVGFTFG